MRLKRAAAFFAAALLVAPAAFALQSDAGSVVAVDRERQEVTLHNGAVYYLPNRVFLPDFKGRPRAVIWYRVENGRRVVVNYRTTYFNFDE